MIKIKLDTASVDKNYTHTPLQNVSFLKNYEQDIQLMLACHPTYKCSPLMMCHQTHSPIPHLGLHHGCCCWMQPWGKKICVPWLQHPMKAQYPSTPHWRQSWRMLFFVIQLYVKKTSFLFLFWFHQSRKETSVTNASICSQNSTITSRAGLS